ncbi:MAG: pantetheine-phosphate adenylyltransferase [Polyangiales bacterium]
MSIAIYPGSFDPVTHGHLSIIHSGLKAFDRVVVAVLHNPKKQPLFPVTERIQMIREAVGDEPRIEVDAFDGLLVDYARQRGAKVLLRGLRAVADFEYELQMANMNRHLSQELVTVFIMAHDAYFYVSSNLVKEVSALGGDVSKLVPDSVAKRLQVRLAP